MCIDSRIRRHVAIIVLRTGLADLCYFPLSVLTPMSSESTTMPPDARTGVPGNTVDEITSLYDVTRVSTTTASGISRQSSSATDQTRTPPSNSSAANGSATAEGRSREYSRPLPIMKTIIIGPMMYVYFSAANTSDAGFTVDLLFRHHSYMRVSLRIPFLADRTNGRAIATLLRLSSVCDVMYCG